MSADDRHQIIRPEDKPQADLMDGELEHLVYIRQLEQQRLDHAAKKNDDPGGRWVSALIIVMIIGALQVVPLWVSLPAALYCMNRTGAF